MMVILFFIWHQSKAESCKLVSGGLFCSDWSVIQCWTWVRDSLYAFERMFYNLFYKLYNQARHSHVSFVQLCCYRNLSMHFTTVTHYSLCVSHLCTFVLTYLWFLAQQPPKCLFITAHFFSLCSLHFQSTFTDRRPPIWIRRPPIWNKHLVTVRWLSVYSRMVGKPRKRVAVLIIPPNKPEIIFIGQ